MIATPPAAAFGPQWHDVCRRPTLGIDAAEWILERLLDDVYADRVPPAAREVMHEFFDRFESRRGYFLHHFAPLLDTLDCELDVATSKPRLLDVGCGIGTQAHVLALRGARVVGVDADPRRIFAGREMRQWYVARAPTDVACTLVVSDMLAFLRDADTASFDGAYTQFALAYMPPREPIVRELGRVIRPGGALVLRELNTAGLFNRLREQHDWPDDRGYEAMAAASGFRCRSRTFSWILPAAIVERTGRPRARTVERIVEALPIARTLGAVQTLVLERTSAQAQAA